MPIIVGGSGPGGGGPSDDYGRRPTRDEFMGLNRDSPQVRGLVGCFPMWDGAGAAAMDVSPSGMIAYPVSGKNLSTFDPVMGQVYKGTNGGVPRGGGKGTSFGGYHIPYPMHEAIDPGYSHFATAARPNPISFSMSAWVNLSIDGWVIAGQDIEQAAAGGNNPPNAYVTTFASSGGAFPGWGFGVAQGVSGTAQNNVYVELDADGNAIQSTIIGNRAINDGLWHLIVGVYDYVGGGTNASGGHMRTYVDGVFDADETTAQYAPSPATAPPVETPYDDASGGVQCTIGSDTDFISASWLGMFCDFRFYLRALQPADIQAMYAPETRWELYRAPRQVFPLTGVAPGGTADPIGVASDTGTLCMGMP